MTEKNTCIKRVFFDWSCYKLNHYKELLEWEKYDINYLGKKLKILYGKEVKKVANIFGIHIPFSGGSSDENQDYYDKGRVADSRDSHNSDERNYDGDSQSSCGDSDAAGIDK